MFSYLKIIYVTRGCLRDKFVYLHDFEFNYTNTISDYEFFD